jgi:NADH-quinone oxidoreductase subunit K
MIHVGLSHFLVVAALLFSLGVICVTTRRNAVAVLIGIELILNSACLNFVSFSRYVEGGINGYVFALFIIVLAAAEAVVALSLILAHQKRVRTVDIDKIASLKG